MIELLQHKFEEEPHARHRRPGARARRAAHARPDHHQGHAYREKPRVLPGLPRHGASVAAGGSAVRVSPSTSLPISTRRRRAADFDAVRKTANGSGSGPTRRSNFSMSGGRDRGDFRYRTEEKLTAGLPRHHHRRRRRPHRLQARGPARPASISRTVPRRTGPQGRPHLTMCDPGRHGHTHRRSDVISVMGENVQ